MSNLTLTNDGVAQIAAKVAAGVPLLLKKMAVSPNTAGAAIDPAWSALPEELPTQYNITSISKVAAETAALYSTTLDDTVGDFDINLIGLYDEDGILVLVDEITTFEKRTGATANIFRHNAILNFENNTAAMPLNLPTAQFHPETIKIQELEAVMDAAMDVAVVSADSFSVEVPRLENLLADLRSRQDVLVDTVTNVVGYVSDNQTKILGLQNDVAAVSADAASQIATLEINNADGNPVSITGPKVRFTGSLASLSATQSNELVFEVPEEQKGLLVKIPDDQQSVFMSQLRFDYDDDFIRLKRNPANPEMDIAVGLNPDRLRSFGTVEIISGSSLTTMSAEGLDQKLSLMAGVGIDLQMDDQQQTVTIASTQADSFDSATVTSEGQVTTLRASNSKSLRFVAGDNVTLTANSDSNQTTINSYCFSTFEIRANSSENDATMSATEQDTLVFQESDTVGITLIGYGDNQQAVRFHTSFPTLIRESFEINGGNLLVTKDLDQVGGTIYCQELHCTGDIVGFSTTTPSDVSLKTDLTPLTGALEMLQSLSCYRFKWAEGLPINESKEDLGLLAQEVQEVIPEVVRPMKIEPLEAEVLGVDYARLVPVLMQAIKELEERVRELEKR